MRVVRLRVPAGEARPGPQLSPVLGQHQIKPAEFVVEFNRLTSGYPRGLSVGVHIHRRGPTWTLRGQGPTLADLLYHTRGPRGVRVEDLAGCLTYRFGRWGPRHVRAALGTLKSLGVPLG